jgi:hypothetical protein
MKKFGLFIAAIVIFAASTVQAAPVYAVGNECPTDRYE